MTRRIRQSGVRADAINLHQPPTDPLLAAIPEEVRDDWRRNPTPELIRSVSACGCQDKYHEG